MKLDQVLSIAAGAIELGVKGFGIGIDQGGYDEAIIEAERRGLDASNDTALASPWAGAMTDFGVAAQGILRTI